jgi:hypothetical protein
MNLPRKGILIRLFIYVPLLGFFGWQAYQRYRAEQTVEQDAKAAPELEGRKTKFTLPDGKSVEVVEISEEQARQMGLEPGRGGSAEAPAKAAPAGDPKAPAAGAN